MKLYKWTPVLLAAALMGCPDKDTGETDDPGTDTEDPGTEDPGTEDPGTEDPGTEGTEAPMALCDDSTLVTTPFNISGDDFPTDFPANEDYSTGTNCSTGSSFGEPEGNDVRYEVFALAGQTIRISEVGGFDSSSYIMAACDAGDECLNANEDPDELSEYVVDADGQYLVVLSGYSASPFSTDYDFTIQVVDPEDCTDDVDNDGDGYTSCGDTECVDDAACDDVCLAEEGATFPLMSADSSPSGFQSNYTFVNCETSASGGEYVVAIDATAGDVISVTESNPSFDAVVRITDACGPEAACLAESDIPDNTTFTVVNDGTYYAVIEAYYLDEFDDFEYTIGLNPADAETCDSGTDDDLDGLTDCADSECADEPECQEVCNSGIDEDADGDIDCADDDCFATTECPYTCPVDTSVTLPFTESGTLADLSVLDTPFDYDDGEECLSASGQSKIYQVTVPAGQHLRATETNPDEDMVIHILDQCAPGSDCLDSGDTPDEARYFAETETTVYVVLQVWSSSNSDGDYTVEFDLLPPEDCSSLLDEDEDGDIGCADDDCVMDAACFEMDCADGITNDDDLLIDCMDDDCDDSADCIETNCTDGLDNELDGFTDCDDSDCDAEAACAPTFQDTFADLSNWTVTVASEAGTTGQWEIGTDASRFAGTDGSFAQADSDAAGSGLTDTSMTLTTPIDLSGTTTASLTFLHRMRTVSSTTSDTAVVFASSDGVTFSEVANYDSGTGDGVLADINLDAYAGGDLTLRFRYTGNWAWYWLVDDVQVFSE